MTRVTLCTLAVSVAVVASGCPEASESTASSTQAAPASDEPPEPFDDWYPADITPPEGTQYPCALTALPEGLPGIPGPDHRFINHVYAQILSATQAKLALYRDFEREQDKRAVCATYIDATDEALVAIRAEDVPQGLESFRDDVVRAIELQQDFFLGCAERLAEASDRIRSSDMTREQSTQAWQRAWQEMHQIPAGREASQLLIGAWGKMQARYPGCPAAMRDSIFHHLCALDVF